MPYSSRKIKQFAPHRCIKRSQPGMIVFYAFLSCEGLIP